MNSNWLLLTTETKQNNKVLSINASYIINQLINLKWPTWKLKSRRIWCDHNCWFREIVRITRNSLVNKLCMVLDSPEGVVRNNKHIKFVTISIRQAPAIFGSRYHYEFPKRCPTQVKVKCGFCRSLASSTEKYQDIQLILSWVKSSLTLMST